jgi:hypothetical protein
MSEFTRDTVATRDAGGPRDTLRLPPLGIAGRPALVFCQYFTGPVDDRASVPSGTFDSDRFGTFVRWCWCAAASDHVAWSSAAKARKQS